MTTGIYSLFAKLAAGTAALTMAGCTAVYTDELAADAAFDGAVQREAYRGSGPGRVPPLPDYGSDVSPAGNSGWTGDWRRDAGGVGDRIEDYRLIDAADGLAQAIGDAPPDFAFRFDGRDAWAWVSDAGEAMIVEPSPYGVIQYYFGPRAAAPYLVRDVYQSYAYEGPEFILSYGPDGRVDLRVPSPRALDNADRLQARGRAIMAATYRRRWDDQVAANWSVQIFSGYGFGDGVNSGTDRGWSGGWQPRWRDHRDWRSDRERNREWNERRRLNEEARDRADSSDRFRQWRRGGRRGTAPGVRRGGTESNGGVDGFVQPVSPPVFVPPANPGPIMQPGAGNGEGLPSNGAGGPRRSRPGMVPPVGAVLPPTSSASGGSVSDTAPEVARPPQRPRSEPGMQTQPTIISEAPILDTAGEAASPQAEAQDRAAAPASAPVEAATRAPAMTGQANEERQQVHSDNVDEENVRPD